MIGGRVRVTVASVASRAFRGKGTENVIKATDNTLKGTDNIIKGTDNSLSGVDDRGKRTG